MGRSHLLYLREVEGRIIYNMNLHTSFKLHIGISNEGHSKRGNITDAFMRTVRLQ